ncbi:MerR family transcriptional regulator [Kibdelosporangium phytohabitans]|uniref:MerR family transcriptional regulator n=1 Tax=Kibdelosporangium phytohabitans TaxID=860235 RepID=A0A0N9IEM5_9PSEU|nr:MerR family transcriptional regulator [Kibdelosporangium phytohabitans]ALG14994.1 MerR family transcriptional regulator [Kibdelosporangium phytohabitans]MBE1469298.1 DNA-binding transcriptional MerR regulator [Kibdelosporangium phytohabitans]
MGWSTRQLAELAGTSLRAVRHYHDIGLLPEPERRANGYKNYGVADLVRVLRIKRLTGLGLSLAQIAELGDEEYPEEALRALDAELAATIDRLERIRVELALILRRPMPTDLPPMLSKYLADTDMPAADRQLAVVLAQVLSPAKLGAYAATLRDYRRDPAVVEFDSLPADADEQTRKDLAERLVPHFRKTQADFPQMNTLLDDAPRGRDFALRTIAQAVSDIYNPAQIDVLVRASG